MKKVIVILLAALLLAALCACGGSKTAELSFKNSLTTTVDGLYVSPMNEDQWSEPINNARIQSGSTYEFNFDAAGKNAKPGDYDIGVIDENAMNYDAYGVSLKVGDKLELNGHSQRATLIVTHADGSKDNYAVYIYPNE